MWRVRESEGEAVTVRPLPRWLLVEPLTQQEVARVEGLKSSVLVIPDETPRKAGKAPKFKRWCRVYALPPNDDSGMAVGDTVFCDVTRGSHGPDNEFTVIDGRKVLHMPIADVMAVL